MNRRDELERLRIELKRKVDAIIDEAISRVEGNKWVNRPDGRRNHKFQPYLPWDIRSYIEDSQHTDEKQQENRIRKQSENSNFQSSESGSDDSGSVIFDCSYMQQLSENENEERTDNHFRNTQDVSSSSRPFSYSKSTPDESSSFTSPVLKNSSMKRAHSEAGLVFLYIEC